MPTDARAAASLAQLRRKALARLLAAEELDAGSPATIVPRDPAAEVPLSFAQEVLWLLDRATPGLTAYNSPAAARVLGPLDVDALARAATALVSRHEALRTAFATVDERAVQFPVPPSPVAIARCDVRALPAERRAAAGLEFLREVAGTPFDLTEGKPLRVAVAQLAEGEH
ncbi:MAG: condensation domain-containing protein, partial [Candidatus Eremiobacteraeota bacterium]|nr:condensation domain-containing protein [Candidatus Eremiobacteraeota bacterium]